MSWSLFALTVMIYTYVTRGSIRRSGFSFDGRMIILRNLGDEIYVSNSNWIESINFIKLFSKILLTMAMAAIGLSTNLKDIKSMGYKPFIVGFIAMLTVGIVCIITIESYLRFFI